MRSDSAGLMRARPVIADFQPKLPTIGVFVSDPILAVMAIKPSNGDLAQ